MPLVAATYRFRWSRSDMFPWSSTVLIAADLPRVGDSFGTHEAFGSVESVKAVSDLFAPLSGEVAAANGALAGSPELVNGDPYGEGWMIKLRLTAPDEVDGLLDSGAYDALIAAG